MRLPLNCVITSFARNPAFAAGEPSCTLRTRAPAENCSVLLPEGVYAETEAPR